jgi:hypothetical protein
MSVLYTQSQVEILERSLQHQVEDNGEGCIKFVHIRNPMLDYMEVLIECTMEHGAA